MRFRLDEPGHHVRAYDPTMTMPAGVLLRPATPDDAEAGARLHIACWREVYGPLTEPDLLATHLADEAAWAERWRQQVEDGPTRLLAVADGELVGFGVAGPARHDDVTAAHELYAIYVRAAWHGTGVGTALLDGVLGDAAAYLWVHEENARAEAFYRRHGFTADGVRQRYEPLGAWERRLVRP